MLNEDYKDMLRALSEEKVRFLLGGAYALAAHGYPRATMDIDIWVLPSPHNADAVLRALLRFGAPLHHLAKEDLQRDGTVFQIGVAPRLIDIITAASGLQFEETCQTSLSVNIKGIEVHIPSGLNRECFLVMPAKAGKSPKNCLDGIHRSKEVIPCLRKQESMSNPMWTEDWSLCS